MKTSKTLVFYTRNRNSIKVFVHMLPVYSQFGLMEFFVPYEDGLYILENCVLRSEKEGKLLLLSSTGYHNI